LSKPFFSLAADGSMLYSRLTIAAFTATSFRTTKAAKPSPQKQRERHACGEGIVLSWPI